MYTLVTIATEHLCITNCWFYTVKGLLAFQYANALDLYMRLYAVFLDTVVLGQKA